jgi:ubiquinone/menaquinone biosynthesis C-methylase UbiE
MNLLSVAQMLFSAFAKPKQHVVIQEMPIGRVLDIGGGGEGVIAQAGGARVVAIDRRASEIHEARGKATDAAWLVADATRLPCRSHCLDSATAFFSCMYMSDDVKREAFREAGRALKKGGELWIWDAQMVPRGEMFAIRVRVDIRDQRTISTTYGVRAKEQSAAGIAGLLGDAGFESEVIVNQEHWFMIKAKRSSGCDESEDARA